MHIGPQASSLKLLKLHTLRVGLVHIQISVLHVAIYSNHSETPHPGSGTFITGL